MEFKRTEPPFGASGFTYSKWLKPSGYLADPFIAIDEALIRFLTVKVKNFDLDANYFTKKDESEKKESSNN